ncbi:MAG: glycosyltransferase [Lysobacteraceae bacterium]|nr:MAG: glycosyltransferase [Xanthomonadaceae bacterium]
MTLAVAASRRTVLAVLVLYGRKPDEAASWSTLLALLGQDGPLRLDHCVVHDNSPERHVPTIAPASNISVRWTPDNSGTAGAYIEAAHVARAHGCEWLLLLDQDTDLPADYLNRAAHALDDQPDASVLVPKVRHGGELVSPATIGRTGSVQPTACPTAHAGIPTAISSGIIMHHTAFAAVLPFPRAIWLDYVDHWMFLSFARRGLRMGFIDADLSHDLSIRTPHTLSTTRLAGILAAENAFNDAMSDGGRGWLRLRRLIRAIRYAANGQFGHAGTVIRYTLPRATLS